MLNFKVIQPLIFMMARDSKSGRIGLTNGKGFQDNFFVNPLDIIEIVRNQSFNVFHKVMSCGNLAVLCLVNNLKRAGAQGYRHQSQNKSNVLCKEKPVNWV